MAQRSGIVGLRRLQRLWQCEAGQHYTITHLVTSRSKPHVTHPQALCAQDEHLAGGIREIIVGFDVLGSEHEQLSSRTAVEANQECSRMPQHQRLLLSALLGKLQGQVSCMPGAHRLRCADAGQSASTVCPVMRLPFVEPSVPLCREQRFRPV